MLLEGLKGIVSEFSISDKGLGGPDFQSRIWRCQCGQRLGDVAERISRGEVIFSVKCRRCQRINILHLEGSLACNKS